MTWFYVDDSFHTHPKALAAGNAAVGLWTRCGSWVGRHLTDGWVPSEIARLYGTKTEARRLVDSALWERDTERGGYVMHDYLDWNKSKAEVEAKREVRARAGRLGGQQTAKHKASNRQANASGLLEHTGEAKSNPVPSLPFPVEQQTSSVVRSAAKPRSTTKKGTRIPEPFEISDEMKEWKRENCPDVQGWPETERFVDYWRGQPGAKGVKVDWVATWRNWMRRAQDDMTGGKRGSTVVPLAGRKPSTTDSRMADGAALVARLEAQQMKELGS